MATSSTTKPATSRDTRKRASKVEQLGGELDFQSTEKHRAYQVRRIARLHALSNSTAATVAGLAYGVCP